MTNLINEVGNTYGTYTVIERGPNICGMASFICECSCGTKRNIEGKVLRKGKRLTCSSCAIPDLEGFVVGELEFLERKPGTGKSDWYCKSCNQVLTLYTSAVVKGRFAKDCPCFQRPRKKEHPLYTTWRGMIGRCTWDTYDSFPNYGGRGITVCESWRKDFWSFVEDMGEKPTPKHSLDRIDVNGHYEPGNVRWATRKEQNNNRRNNIDSPK